MRGHHGLDGKRLLMSAEALVFSEANRDLDSDYPLSVLLYGIAV
jgi:hypothetical protein